MIVWCVRVEGRTCVFETFSEAWEDYKTHEDYLFLMPNPAWIYPKIMSKKKLESLSEFTGW